MHEVNLWAEPKHPLADLWVERFGDASLLGVLPRSVRFHSLPRSRQYPRRVVGRRTDEREILRRHTTLIGELEDLAPAGFIYRPEWGPEDRQEAVNARWISDGITWRPLARVFEPDSDPDDPGIELLVTDAPDDPRWRTWWLVTTAHDLVYMASLVASDASWSATPYPGGIDISAPTEEIRDALAARYREWLPWPTHVPT